MLAGIYYGASYGGSTTAILVNLPGETSSVVTALDGYQMARKGQAGRALAVAAIGSFVAGCVATILIAAFAKPLAAVALKFGPPEYFSLMALGLVASIVLASGSLFHAFAMLVMGLLLGLVGADVNSGFLRFTGGIPQLYEGIDFVVVAMGVFGVSEILANLETEYRRSVMHGKITGLMPTREDRKRMKGPILRGTLIGSILGILPPGGGTILASFASYALEKRISKRPEEFGQGAIEGVAGPELANNAGAQTSFIPMLSLGIPSNPVMALMMGAMMIQGIQPGAIHDWRAALAVLGSDRIDVGRQSFPPPFKPAACGVWARMVTIPYHYLYPGILLFCVIGAFSLNNDTFDIYLMAGFGVFGYVLRKLSCEMAPLLLGFILGPMMEEYLSRSLLLSQNDFSVFIFVP